MIHPLAPMTFRAIIWYQGEANRGDKSYDKKMRYLWDSWRKVFEQPDLPFYFAQIAPFEYKGAHHSPELWRQQQFFADENYPAAGLVVTMDVGDLKGLFAIHLFLNQSNLMVDRRWLHSAMPGN
jgi:sialate O-acetylesterase